MTSLFPPIAETLFGLARDAVDFANEHTERLNFEQYSGPPLRNCSSRSLSAGIAPSAVSGNDTSVLHFSHGRDEWCSITCSKWW